VITIAPTPGSDPDLTASVQTITFTPDNWNVPQPVSFLAAQDADSINGRADFVLSAPGVRPVTFSVTEVDDDIVPAAPVTLRASADAFVRDGSYAGRNFGGLGELQIKKDATGYNREIYLKFDLTDPDLTSIGSAKLRLYGKIDSATEFASIAAYGAADTSWNESTLTWDNRPAADGSQLAARNVSTSAYKWYEWDVTSYLQAQRAAGATAVTLVLRSQAKTGPNPLFNSDEAATNRPQLVIIA
jgi:hypothetical protein